MMNFSTIALSKGYFFAPNVIDTVSEEDMRKFISELTPLSSDSEIISIQAEVMRYGYMFDTHCLRYMLTMTHDQLVDVSKDIADYLADTYGDGNFVSLFGNFPETRLRMSEIEVFFKQIIHYLSGGEFDPSISNNCLEDAEITKDNYSVCFRDSYKLIKLCDVDTLVDLFKHICSAQQSITKYDKEVVEYFCNHYQNLHISLDDLIPSEIPFKETLCLIAANIPSYPLNTVTDILRLAVYMSGGDITLPHVPTAKDYGWENYMKFGGGYCEYYRERIKELRSEFNFRKFNRAERRMILSKMERVFNIQRPENAYADMKKYASKWVRLGEILHPGEYKNQYPETVKAFYLIRETANYITTFNSRVEQARVYGTCEDVVSILSERPSEFARNIDWVIRKYSGNTDYIINGFKSVIDKVSTKVLYELINYYHTRNNADIITNRTVFLKGARKPVSLKDLSPIDNEVRTSILNVLISELSNRFVAKGDLAGLKYVLDAQLSNIVLPKNMRSMNVAPGQQSRGTKINIKCDTGILRMYCRWMDIYGQYDLDLACVGLDEKFNKKFSLSWNSNYRLENQGKTVAIFSGDVRHRKGNSAEYIDVDLEGMKKMGVRYLVGDVRDFDGNGFEAKDAWAGVMERDTFGTPGEVTWAPDTIATGFKLTSKCTNIIMTVVDLQNMVMYVVDEDTAGIPVATESNAHSIIARRYVTYTPYFDVLSLIEMNLRSRNAQVSVLSHDDFISKMTELDNTKNKLQALLKDAIDLRDATDRYDHNFTEVCANVNYISEKLSAVESIKSVSYDDISTDYTSIFEWMF